MTLVSRDFDTRHEMEQYANGRASRGVLTMFDPRHLTDEQFIEVSDGTNVVQLTIDAGGDGVSAGVAVDTSGVADGDEDALADAIIAAIAGATLNITPTKVSQGSGVGSKSKIELLNDAAGENNVPITQGIQGGGDVPFKFETTGMGGGADGITTTDIIRIMELQGRWILFWNVP